MTSVPSASVWHPHGGASAGRSTPPSPGPRAALQPSRLRAAITVDDPNTARVMRDRRCNNGAPVRSAEMPARRSADRDIPIRVYGVTLAAGTAVFSPRLLPLDAFTFRYQSNESFG